jgi:protein TonB
MTETTFFSDYGFRELRKFSQKFAGQALGISIFIHLFLSTSYIAVTKFLERPSDKEVRVRIVKYTELGPPPSITNAPPPPQLAVTAPVTKPTVGIPKPVPDAEVSPEQTIATQTEMAQQPAPITSAGDNEGAIQIEANEDPGMGEFQVVEEQPVLIKKVVPIYPDLARKAGLEGTVYILALVDLDGTIKRVVIQKGSDMFNEAAISAVKQWVYKPAINANQPVKVWVGIPVKFNLREAAQK